MIRIAIPGVTVLVVVAAFVSLSSWNRSAEPRQTLVVTEREVSLAWNAGRVRGDDPAVQLRLEIEHRNEPLDSKNWLPEDRLRALGFTLNVPPAAPEAMATYQRIPPRLGWVVLEYDGPAFQEIERRRALRRETDGPWRFVNEPSRLVPVDAGPDFEPLRAKYSSNHLVVRAVIGLRYVGPGSGGPLIYGLVRQVVPATITVPRSMRPVLEGLDAPSPVKPDGPHPPRYEADVASGPLGVLYLRRLRRIG